MQWIPISLRSKTPTPRTVPRRRAPDPLPAAILVLALTGACAAPDPSPKADGDLGGTEVHPKETTAVQPTAHREATETWRTERLEALTQPDGWLSLVGLFWLETGDTTVGSDPNGDVVLPESVPPSLGTLNLPADGAPTFVAAEGQSFRVGDETKTRAELITDAQGEPTLVESGTVSFHLIDRDGRIGIRAKDSSHPDIAAFSGIDHYPVDLRWRFEAVYEPYDTPKDLTIPTVLGTPTSMQAPGSVRFELDGEVRRLDVLDNGDGNLFIIFADATNGSGTYGAGRFLYASVEGGDLGRAAPVVLDFNRAQNPPCAFTPWATCPLPPQQNRIVAAIEAGEKAYGDH